MWPYIHTTAFLAQKVSFYLNFFIVLHHFLFAQNMLANQKQDIGSNDIEFFRNYCDIWYSHFDIHITLIVLKNVSKPKFWVHYKLFHLFPKRLQYACACLIQIN